MSGIGHNSASKGGYIIITREMIDHPIVGAGQPMKPDDPSKEAYSKFEAWVDLLRQAAYKARKVLNKGREVTLERGDIMCANSFLAKRWNWSPKAVRNYLNRLQEWEMINGDWQKKGDLKPKYRGNQNKVLSICNYSYYQGAAREEGQPRGNQKGNQQGNQGATVTACKTSKKCSRDELPRQPEGQPKGQQYNNQDNNQYNQYKKITPIGVTKKGELGFEEIKNNKKKLDFPSGGSLHEKKIGCRLQDSWEPTEGDLCWAKEDLVLSQEQINFETDNFKDYWISRPGKSATKLDWSRTWKTWMRKSHKEQVLRNENIELNNKRYGRNKNSHVNLRNQMDAIVGNPKKDLVLGGGGEAKTQSDIIKDEKSFELFWQACPKKINKPETEEIFTQIINGLHNVAKKTAPDDLIEGMEYYKKAMVDTEGQYIKTPSNWLNDSGWFDEYKGFRRLKWGWWRNFSSIDYLDDPESQSHIAAHKAHKKTCNTKWNWTQFGPPPGHPECYLREEILNYYLSDAEGSLEIQVNKLIERFGLLSEDEKIEIDRYDDDYYRPRENKLLPWQKYKTQNCSQKISENVIEAEAQGKMASYFDR